MSDHGMVDYVLELWDCLAVCFKARVEYLTDLVEEDSFQIDGEAKIEIAQQMYTKLEHESADLGLFWKYTQPIYDLIHEKENKFGNFTMPGYETYESSEQLAKMRKNIMTQIETFKREQKKNQDL